MPWKRDLSPTRLLTFTRSMFLPSFQLQIVKPSRLATLAIPLTLIACGDKEKTEDTNRLEMPAKENPSKSGKSQPQEEVNTKKRVPGTFEPELIKEFLTWKPVLAGDVAFASRGHGGILVRSYLNPVASDAAAKPSDPYPLAVGSILAKAVVSNASAPASSASRVYFMRKEAAGFDPRNGDWSYGLAQRAAGGQLEIDPDVSPKQDYCVSCHTKVARFDYVQTVDYFRRQSTSPAP